jgi:glutamate--cysteine ligase
MRRLTESAAEQLIAARAFATGPPGFVGAALDLPAPAKLTQTVLDQPAPAKLTQTVLDQPAADRGPGRPARWTLRHGFLVERADGTVTVSGPPSPGLESCLARMGDDLATRPEIRPDGGAAAEIRPGSRPGGGAMAGIRVGLEAGLDGGGPLGLPRRWSLAHTLAPVLAAAFANSPSPDGWRSVRAARHRGRPVLPGIGCATAANPCIADLSGIDPRSGRSPRASWTAYVMDAGDRTFRDWVRSDDPPGEADLWRHLDGLRAPVTARGHLELDFADGQEGDGWRVAVAVVATLLDDPVAATAAESATAHLAYGNGVWERAARDALSDAELAAAARECFVAAYAALARRGAPRDLRDAVAAFTDSYVMRGRCPADDLIAAGRRRTIEAG